MALPPAFHELAAEVSNRGRWGADDRRGTLNLIDEAAARARERRDAPRLLDDLACRQLPLQPVQAARAPVRTSPSSRRIAFSYRAKFETKQDEWIEVRIPVDEFEATSFGRVVRGQLDPSQVNGLGILLGDKKAGPFKLEVEWIKVVKPNG